MGSERSGKRNGMEGGGEKYSKYGDQSKRDGM